MTKVFNRDVRISSGALYVNEIKVIDESGNIDAPVTTTNLTTSGNTTLGDASADTITLNGTTTANAPITVGVDDTGYDVKMFGATSGAYALFDESADTFKTVGGYKTDLQGTLTVGVNDTGYDVTLYGATAGQKVFWDESADTLNLDCTNQIDGTVTVGVDDTGYDVKFFGATASAYMLWDESADDLIFAGVAGLQATGTGLIGYGTGSGGTVTQSTSRSTGVTLSKTNGQITTDTTSLAAGAAATFTVTNTLVAATDVIIANIASGATTNQTNVRVTAVAAGSYNLTVENNHASTAETGAIVINVAVIKGVSA